jgi:hypothetical protein
MMSWLWSPNNPRQAPRRAPLGRADTLRAHATSGTRAAAYNRTTRSLYNSTMHMLCVAARFGTLPLINVLGSFSSDTRLRYCKGTHDGGDVG